jgi:hypothetical protein
MRVKPIRSCRKTVLEAVPENPAVDIQGARGDVGWQMTVGNTEVGCGRSEANLVELREGIHRSLFEQCPLGAVDSDRDSFTASKGSSTRCQEAQEPVRHK